MTELDIDQIDRALLNSLQTAFPLVPRPYAELGVAHGLTEEDVLERVLRLRKTRILRQISGIFNTNQLGYQSSLVAMRIPEERVDEAAAIVSTHPGVSHNYHRGHSFNLWFTIAVPPTTSLRETVDRLHALTEAESTRLLPSLKVFKLGVFFDMDEGNGGRRGQSGENGGKASGSVGRNVSGSQSAPSSSDAPATVLDDVTIRLVRGLQEDLATVARPFASGAERMGLSEEEYLAGVKQLLELGIMRRFAAVLHHRKAGFSANAMGVWQVPAERAQEVGQQMANVAAVSHCYERPSYPDWPYNLFTMVHGRSQDECEEILQDIAQRVGVNEYRALYSDREYKKVRLQFFTDDYAEWDRKYLGK